VPPRETIVLHGGFCFSSIGSIAGGENINSYPNT